MPNVIKSNCVLITKNDVKVIDSNFKDDFTPMSYKTAVEVEDGTSSEGELSSEEELYQVNHSDNNSHNLHEMQAYADTIIEDAKKEAEELRLEAIRNADQEIEQLKANAIEEGHQEGIQKGQLEINDRLEQVNQKEQKLEQDYDQKMMQMQSHMTDILIELVKKITGVVIEEKSVITYLVCEALKGQSTCNEFKIIVSKADYPTLNENIDQLKDLVRSTAMISIVENPEFEQNQCRIETDKNIIECGIETKLSNLVMALKLLM